jgi:hypothetical protein
MAKAMGITIRRTGEYIVLGLLVLGGGVQLVLSYGQMISDRDESLRQIPHRVHGVASNFFDTGFKLGWACGHAGGTVEDGLFLMKSFHEKDSQSVSNWFEKRK